MAGVTHQLAEANARTKAAQADLVAAIRTARAEGLSLREIATVLECSPETVRKLSA